MNIFLKNTVSTTKQVIFLTSIALTTLALNAGGYEGKHIGDVDLEDYACEDCPELLPWDWTLIPSLGYLDNEASRFQNYTGIEDGANLFLNGWTMFRDEDGFYWSTNFHRLGLDSGGLTTEFGKQSQYKFTLAYDELPIVYDTYLTTPFLTRGNALQLPGGWTTTSSSFVPSNSPLFSQFDLTSDWQTLGLSFEYQTESNIQYELDYRSLNKDGQREYSIGQMLNATYIPLPVSNETEDMTARISWLDDNWYMSLTGFVSRFDNDVTTVTVDYPFTTLTAGSEQSQLAGAPQNVFRQYALDLRYRYAPRSQFKVRYASGTLEQDEPLTSYSLNPLFQSPLPTNNLDAEVSTTDLAVHWTHQINPDWRLNIKYRDRERDNETQVYEWQNVITDLYVAGTLMNLPYDYNTEKLSVGVNFRLAMNQTMNLAFKQSDRERTLQQISENSEDGFEFKYRGVIKAMSFNFLAEQYDRDSSEKVLVDYLGVTENPLLSRYNVAKREQSRYRLLVSTPLGEQANFAFNVGTNEQRYDETQIGLTRNDQDSFGVDFGYQFDDTVQLGLYYQREQIETGLLGSQSVSTSDWLADTVDEVSSYGVHMHITELAETEMSLTVSLNQSNADSTVDVFQPGVARALPDVNSDWTQASIKLNYPVSESLTLIFKYHYEDFSSSDYALEGILPADSLRILTMAGLSEQHQVNYFQISALYRFSEEDD